MDNQTKILLTKNVLLCAAIITAVVAAYTTIQLFQSPERDISLSPSDFPSENQTNNETNQSGISFNIKGKFPDDFETESESKDYENGIIPPHSENSPVTNSHLTARAIYESLPPTQKTKLILVVLLEIILITLAYSAISKKLNSLNNTSRNKA